MRQQLARRGEVLARVFVLAAGDARGLGEWFSTRSSIALFCSMVWAVTSGAGLADGFAGCAGAVPARCSSARARAAWVQ